MPRLISARHQQTAQKIVYLQFLKPLIEEANPRKTLDLGLAK